MPTVSATSRSLMSGSLAMQRSTWAWFVRNVQWVVPSLDIDDTVVLYFVSRFSLLVSFITRSVSEVSKPVGSSHKEGAGDGQRRSSSDHRRQRTARGCTRPGADRLLGCRSSPRTRRVGGLAQGRA